jgi:tetratricopeptide (TPR) repeat protein
MDQDRFKRAMALAHSGNGQEALHELRAMAREILSPDEKALVFYGQAACLQRLGKLEEARNCNRQAVAISPRDEVRARTDLCEAVLCWEERRFQESLRILDNILKQYSDLLRTPDLRDVYEGVQIRRGILLAKFSRPREARPLLEEALSFDPGLVDMRQALYYLGVTLFNLGEKKAAKARFLELLPGSDDDYWTVSARYYLGIIYSEEGAYAKALLEFERVEPHASWADISKDKIYGWLARTYRLVGNSAQAERCEKLARE